MKKTMAACALLLALAACADPGTSDTRGYTKAPLEDPGLLVGGEDATEMAAMSRTNRPRPPLSMEVGEPAAAEEEGEEEEVALAPGVTQAQFDEGRQLFTGAGGCQACHGPNAGGTQLAPNLTDAEWLNVAGPEVGALEQVIRTGVAQPKEYPAPMPAMGGASLNDQQIQALAAYVASIGQS